MEVRGVAEAFLGSGAVLQEDLVDSEVGVIDPEAVYREITTTKWLITGSGQVRA